jgi:hypothetical protein
MNAKHTRQKRMHAYTLINSFVHHKPHSFNVMQLDMKTEKMPN